MNKFLLPFYALILGFFFVLGGVLGWSLIAKMQFDFFASKFDVEDFMEDFVDEIFDRASESDVLTESINPKIEDSLLAQRKIVISSDVDSMMSKRVIKNLFYLNHLDSKKPIELYIQTDGGIVGCAHAIIDTMRMIEAPVNVYALGECASAGTLILISATGKRFAGPYTEISPHINYGSDKKEFSYDKMDRERDIKLYQSTTKIPIDWIKPDQNRFYYFNSEEALKYGLIDEILTRK